MTESLDIISGTVWTHVRTGNDYRIVGCVAGKIAGVWVDGVLYARDSDGKQWWRIEENFRASFAPASCAPASDPSSNA